jgi:gliding motility-associated-like protein
MRKRYSQSALILIFLLCSILSNAQDFSNKGKEFWLCFPQHVPSGNNLATLSIWITSDRASSGTVTMTNGAFSAPFNIPANGLQEIQIPHATGHISNAESGIVIQKSIRVKTDPGKPAVVAYAQQWGAARSAATLLLPTNVLGKNYYATSFNQAGTNSGSYLAKSQFQIIATKPNTQVRITPRTNGTVGASFIISLPLTGDMYQYQADQDLTGSLIESIASPTGGCLPIAVFSGSSALTFGTNSCATGNSYDPLFQQQYPVSTWGKNFGFVPFGDYPNGNPYRVLASQNNTNVYFNGSLVATLNAGQIYPATFNTTPVVLNAPTSITADKPVAVIQYASRQNCSGSGFGDPDMVLLNPIEQNISDITIFSSSQQAITRQWVNILIKTVAVPSFRISFNGGPLNPPTGTWQAFAPLPGYSYLQQLLGAAGSYRLVADSGYNAIAYGFSANFESYAYSAGTNVKDLYQQIGVSTQYGIEPSPSVCKGSPFRFKVSLPYCADSILWDLTQLPGPPVPSTVLIQYTTCTPGVGGPDSTSVVNGVTLYWYSLPTLFTFNTSGTFPVNMTVYKPNTDGCGSEQEIDFDLNVYDPPIADFTISNDGCVAEPVQFTDITTTPRPSYIWNWNFGDPASGPANISGLQNPTHIFSAPGNYTVTFSTITTPGCISAQITKQVIVTDIPAATISGATTVCVNDPSPNITFTASEGKPTYTFTYNINGGPSQTISTTGINTSVTLPVPTNVPGTYRYNLLEVKNTGSTLCVRSYTNTFVDVIVNQNTGLTLTSGSSNQTVCQNGPITDIVYTISGGGNNATATGLPPGVNGVYNAGLFTISGSPTIAGVYNYNITATGLCLPSSLPGVITVKELPTASISGTTTVCLNGTSPQITFTGADGASPFTFTYNINGGPNQTVTTTTGNSVTVAAPTTTAGTYTYNLVSVQEGSAQLCSQAQTGSAIVTVNPLPTANIAGTATVCLNAPSPDITFTGAVGSPPFTFTYNINGGASQTVTTTSGNSVTLPVPTNTAGTFTYNLLGVQEGSGIACSQAQTGSATITVNPLPTASITGSTAVCVNATLPQITFTGAVGTAPYTFTYNINGGPNLTVTTTSGNSVTVTVPTNTAGTFTYNLVGIQEGSANLCSQPQTGSATVIVNPLPTASISGVAEVCLNAPSPLITFTGASGTAPYTFTYNINGGASQTVSTTAGNSVTVPVPTGTAGTFTYNLLSVQDGSSTLCLQAQSGSVAVIVNPLPTSNFTVNTPSCETRTISFTDISTPNAGVITNWLWNFDDPASGPDNTSTLQNPTHIFANAGTYNVSLIVTTDKGCVSVNPPRPVVINERPLAGFIIPEVCLSDTYAQFTDTSRVQPPDNIVAWNWNFGDPPSGPANVSVLQNPQHSYTATGNYNVELIATSNQGCKDTIVQVLTVNGSFPVANFTLQNPTTLCANDSVSIVEASTVFPGNITKVEIYWDNVNQPAVFDTDNFPFTGKIYKHLYPNFQAPLTRSFTIRYRAYSGGVCVNDKIQTITVNAAPKVQFNNLPDLCYDAAPYQIPPSIASEIGGVPGSGVFSGPGVSPTGVFNPGAVGPGTYTIKYTFTSSAAGCVDSLSKTITVRDTASARFTVQPVICERSDISFNSSSSIIPPSAGTITGWLWNFGDPSSGTANTSSLQNPTHSFTSWGTYTVSLTVISSNGCRSTVYSAPVFVNPIPRPRFTFPASSCLPSANVQFTNVSSIPDGTQATFSYLWNFGDPPSGALNTSTGTSPSHIYNTLGPFNVNLQVTSGAGCIRDTTILLNTIHPQPTGSFTVNKPDVCVGQSFQFTDNSNPADGTTTQWNWTMGDGNVRTIPAFSYSYGSAGSYDVSLYIINSFGCRSTTFNQTLTVNPYPIVDAGPDLFILEDGSDTLKAIVNAINPTYLWTPNQYFLSSNTVLNPVVKGVDDIWYTLTVTGRGGCQQSDRVFVKVLKGPEIPNIFSPNGDGVHDKWIINYLDTYPGCTVEIFNRYGQRIFSSTGYGQPWDGTVNGKPVPIGTYYYIVNPKNGRSIMSGYVDVIR